MEWHQIIALFENLNKKTDTFFRLTKKSREEKWTKIEKRSIEEDPLWNGTFLQHHCTINSFFFLFPTVSF